ncbi:hypothetical protein M0D69_12930 [Caballeronia sp. SEWSISQ10-4 2]|uniref:hypothetical protein n=1 Tax=Caballeronia sp. SEWSISQ10-4 2 TaxID=2937438 RepID=UPI00264C03A1|nr:hypothetical protein [Caballeronia sp. SEWSISQ10-4 2]MDN7178902.1 hypothetical protein [Caballeronia sp. SEWSISQ10-4 2]
MAALGEGQIRCLGAAILLAKAHSVRTPLIIFDDAINAIDHDNRSGNRQLGGALASCSSHPLSPQVLSLRSCPSNEKPV